MIPYFQQPTVHLGPLSIHAFGVLVATGILAGSAIVRKRALRAGLHMAVVEDLIKWVLLGGFAGAHLVDRFIYFPGETLEDPISILKFWSGISSFGGFLGAVVGAIIFSRRFKSDQERWSYFDVIAYALPFGWFFGRLGCFVAFDHPGTPTHFLLGEADRNGQVIHNLGLEEALYTALICAAFLLLGRKPRVAGFFTGALCIGYAPIRFLFDFMRTVDVRYGGLTPGQYGSLTLIGVGAVIVRRSQRRAAV